MRLIDADALDYELGASDEDIYFHHMLEGAPTIDAIPVEWLRKYTAVGAAPSGERLTEGKERLVVHRILNDWQKEQEAR